jgi:hypothetical protein
MTRTPETALSGKAKRVGENPLLYKAAAYEGAKACIRATLIVLLDLNNGTVLSPWR